MDERARRRVGMPILTMDFVGCPSRRPPRTTSTGMSRFPPWRRSSRRAAVLREPGGEIGWYVLADPEGNEFYAFTG